MGASHLAGGRGAVILSCVLSSMERVFNKCLWVSKSGRQEGSLCNKEWFLGVVMREDMGRREA